MADRRLQVFHAVAKHLSFTKAAEALFMTQPAVTFQVRQLEEQFDTRLFDRVQGRITLTPAGAAAFEYAERILALSGELEARLRDMSRETSGPLLVGASKTIAEYLLPRILAEFKALHPKIVPRLVVENSEQVQERVAARALDLGFIEGDTHLPTLAMEVCGEDELQVVCVQTHALARQAAIEPRALAGHPYIGREPGSGTREVIDHYLQKAGLPPTTLQLVMEASSPEALKGMVATGLGFTIMSRASVAKEVRLAELAAVPLVPRLQRQLAAVFPKERMQSRLVDAFVPFARGRLRALQAAEAGRA